MESKYDQLSQGEGRHCESETANCVSAVQGPQRATNSNPKQSGGVRNGNRNQHNTRGQSTIEIIRVDVTAMGSNVFNESFLP